MGHCHADELTVLLHDYGYVRLVVWNKSLKYEWDWEGLGNQPPEAIEPGAYHYEVYGRGPTWPTMAGKSDGRRMSHCEAERCGSASANTTRWRLPASQPATLVASVVLPLPPLGLAITIVCTEALLLECAGPSGERECTTSVRRPRMAIRRTPVEEADASVG